jgi:hypothetical protein
MAMHKLWSVLTAVVTLLAFASTARAQHFQPFIEPGYFNPDFQFFAPAEIDYYGDPKPPNTGWFFTYDRLYWGVSRPENGARSWELDFTWGNRFDIGYMTEDDGGWLFNYTHVDGPTGLADTHKAKFSSVELNKVFRLEPLHHNGIVEPFLGVRYVDFVDYGLPPWPSTERFINNIVLGQVGVRAWKNFGLWKLSGEIRGFAGVNYQWTQVSDFTEGTAGGEVRTEAQYSLTRDIALRVGWELLYIGDGVGRNTNIIDNNEDLVQSGVTFGFTVNR